MMNNFFFLGFFYLIVNAQIETLIQDFNEMQFQSNNWKCQISTTQISQIVFSCPSEMNLIKLNQKCEGINRVITDILPHNMIYIYVDFYPISTIYMGDYAYIILDSSIEAVINKGQAGYYSHCYELTDLYLPSTSILSKFHSSASLDIELKINPSGNFSDEGFTFRNIQVFYQRCYKTCKTCSTDDYNKCETCYTSNDQPQNFQCGTCQEENNKFLLHNSGCVQECPTGYDYQTDYICQKSKYLLLLFEDNTNQPITEQSFSSNNKGQSIICNSKRYLAYSTNSQLYKNIKLQSNAVAIRLRVTFMFFGDQYQKQNIQIFLNNQPISSISLKEQKVFLTNGIVLYADNYFQNCQSNNYKFESRIEIIQIINKSNFQIKFQATQQYDNSKSWNFTNIIIEQIICSFNCLSCSHYLQCNQCENNYFLHKGQCVSKCPDYSEINQNKCVEMDEEIMKPDNSKTKYLLKEFYDLSTTKERISQLFTLVSNSANNFAKGNKIYFSYLPEKRVFGGSLVWVDAQFKFNLKIPKYVRRIRVKFQVILGDDFEPGEFSYKINDLSAKVLTKATQNPIKNQQIQGNIENEYIIQVDVYLDIDSFSNLPLEIIFTCSNPTKSVDQAFCALQNLFITAIYSCPIEYRFDLYQYYLGFDPCLPICGDGIVVGQEQCDDGNQLPYDGCYNCMFECKESCIYCVRGYCLRDVNKKSDLSLFSSISQTIYDQQQNQIKQYFIYQKNCQFECEICIKDYCLKCFDGYYLDIDQQCQSICGDSKIVGQEECDDGNDLMQDYCVNCKQITTNKCPEYHCSFCYQGECQKCNYGFTLINNECQQVCGDNLLNKEIVNNQLVEQCDNAESDGCINCIIQPGYICLQIDQSVCWTCHEKCKTCIATQNTILECKECEFGYYPLGKNCLKCDDNCVTCKSQQDMCTSCYRDDCQKCEDVLGLQSNELQRTCEPICGDGLVIQYYEQCDDGNDENGDGCDVFCNLEIVEQSIKFDAKHFNGDKSNDIIIEEKENIKIYCQNITITIEGFLLEEFNCNITISDQSCLLNFQFFKSILKVNKIHILIPYSESQKRILSEILQQELIIIPVDQIFIDNNKQGQVSIISSAQSSLSIIIWVLAPSSIILGLFDYFWAILEILSWINNFYFLNVNYPFNVQTLFLNSDWSSYINFPTYSELNQPDCDYYVQSPQRFSEKGVDPLFINNAQVPFYFIVTSVLLYTLTFALQKFFELIKKYSMRHQFKKQNNFSIFCVQQNIMDNQQVDEQQKVNVKIKYNKVVQKILTKLKLLTIQFRSKIKQTVTLCSLDITIAISLQLIYANQQEHFIITINNYLAFFFSILLFYQLSQAYHVIGIHKSLARSPQFQLIYGCFYENINVENTYGFQFNFVGLIRKIIYIFSTTYFYYQPIIQTVICFLSCLTGVFLLIYSNPFETKSQYVKQLISETGLSIIVFITVIFSVDDSIKKISDESKSVLGWIIISLVGVCVLNELLTVIYEILKLIYLNVKLFIIELKKKQQKKVSDLEIVENNQQNIFQQVNLSRSNSQINKMTNKLNESQFEIESKNQSRFIELNRSQSKIMSLYI